MIFIVVLSLVVCVGFECWMIIVGGVVCRISSANRTESVFGGRWTTVGNA